MHHIIRRWLSREVLRPSQISDAEIHDAEICDSDEETYMNFDVETSSRSSSSTKIRTYGFVDMPPDVFISICEWLAVRDILALRMTCIGLSNYTRLTDIWFSTLKRLNIPLPILPATSRHRFGLISPDNYEWLMRRSIYLQLNWRRPHPVGALSGFHAFGTPIALKMLPGGKYMVSVIQIGGESVATSYLEDPSRLYALVVWDLDHNGLRVPLSSARTTKPFLNLDVAFGKIRGEMSIIMAYSTCSKVEDITSTTIVVLSLSLQALESYADCYNNVSKFHEYDDLYRSPFYIITASETPFNVHGLQLAQLERDMVLMVVHRPRTIVLLFLDSNTRSSIKLGPVRPYDTLPQAIWAAKILPGQNSVLVARVLMEAGAQPNKSTLFSLEIFVLPGSEETMRHPLPISSQFLGGLEIDGFYLSSLETSWFAALHDADGLLPAPANLTPPPISCYITYQNPRGFVHAILAPQAVPNKYITLPNNRGRINRYVYQLPMDKVERHTWRDMSVRPVFLPGAYRSILLLRPHVPKAMTISGLGGAPPIIRFMLHHNSARQYCKFATPRTTGHSEINNPTRDADAMDVDEADANARVAALEDDLPLDERTLRISDHAYEIAADMRHGTTAVAFDESVGRMIIATTSKGKDRMIQVLDFGGHSWEVGRVD